MKASLLNSVFATVIVLALAPVAAAAQCEVGCNTVGSGNNVEHYTFWDPAGERKQGDDGDPYHWDTKPDNCDGEHGACGMYDEDAEALFAAVVFDDFEGLRSMKEALGENLVVNLQRGLIQGLTCDGEVVVSLPISAAQVSALKE